jgi:RNA polymerase sigma-70 factor (ECF subfamily)
LVFVLVLVTSSLTVNASSISGLDNGLQQAVSNYLLDFVTESYNEYYVIGDWSVTIFSSEVVDDIFVVEADAVFTKTLKFKSVDELPYMKAIANVKQVVLESGKLAPNSATELNAQQVVLATNWLNKDIAFQKSELSQYIGMEQSATNRFKLMLNESLELVGNSLNVFYGVDYFSEESYYLDSESDLIESFSQEISANIAKASLEPIIQTQVALPVYHRLTARDYSDIYALTYNPAYTNQNPNGGDCANFVSQCIFAGGIPKDSLWTTYTVSWVNTGKNAQTNNAGLWRYMTNDQGTSGKAYFSEVTRSQAAAGGFILWKSPYSHVAFINKNDTVTMTYNAHNTDCANVSFATSEFANNGYRFFFSTNYAND